MKNSRPIYIMAILAVLLLSLSACQTKTVETTNANSGSNAASAGQVKDLEIEAFNFGFKVNDVQIKKGDTVRLTMKVTSGFHSIAIPEFNVNTGTVNAGESKTVEFVADKAGTFPFMCNVYCGSGHRDMKGELVVLE